MQNNIHQTDIEEFVLPVDKFEKRGVDYYLNDIQIPSVSTILGSGGGGKASANGNAFHEAMASFLLGHHKKQGISVAELFENCNHEDFEIAIRLNKFLKENELTPLYVEHKFYYEIEGCVYAGTIDLICIDKQGRLWIFDYKTGVTKSFKHLVQVSGYKQGKQGYRAFVIYRDEIIEADNDMFNDEFKPLLLAAYGKLEGYINHRGKLYLSSEQNLARSYAIKKRKLEIKELENKIKTLKSEIEIDKQAIIETLESKKSFKDKNILLIFNKGKTTKSLKPKIADRLDKLLERHPNWFETQQNDDYYTLRLATENKEKQDE